jgi:hypothetical protein
MLGFSSTDKTSARWKLKIQADDVRRLFGKFGIGADVPTTHALMLNPILLQHVADAAFLGSDCCPRGSPPSAAASPASSAPSLVSRCSARVCMNAAHLPIPLMPSSAIRARHLFIVLGPVPGRCANTFIGGGENDLRPIHALLRFGSAAIDALERSPIRTARPEPPRSPSHPKLFESREASSQ